MERREEILDAAMAAVRGNGPLASMEQIAAAAGVTKPVVYRHFDDRADLVAALAGRFAGDLARELTAVRGSDPRAVIAGAVDAYLAFVERDPAIYRFIVQESGPAPAAFMRAVGDHVAELFGRLVGSGRGAEPMAHGIVGMVRAAGDWWLAERSMTRAEVVEHLTALVWSGLAALLPVEAAR